MTKHTSSCFAVKLHGPKGASVQFVAANGRSIVRSAAIAGLKLTTGCLQGRCAICRARLLSGDVHGLRKHAKHAINSPVDRADGYVLLCSVAPHSDLELELLSPWEIIDPC